MRLEGTTVRYTNDDIDNLTIYDYTQEELDEQIEAVKTRLRSSGNMSFPIFVFGMILLVFSIIIRPTSEPLFVGCLCIAPCMVLLGIVMFMSIYPKQGKCYPQYIKVVVAEKKGVITKTWTEKGGHKGSYSMSFYPLIVNDTKTGYRTRIYCFEDEYKNAKEGKRINLKYRRSYQRIDAKWGE